MLYEVETKLTTMDGKSVDTAVETFAFREIAAEGTRLPTVPENAPAGAGA